MIVKILVGLAVLIVVAIGGVLIAASMQPAEFRVERSLFISAPPSAIFPYLNNQKENGEWDPWKENDPNMKQRYEGPASGVGAVVIWDGNDQVGAGKSTIIESLQDELVKVKLDFIRPFEGTSTAEFNLKPEGNGTLVTWSMYGPNQFIGKIMGLFMDCEKMCGDEFNKGLAKLKNVVEKKSAQSQAQN